MSNNQTSDELIAVGAALCAFSKSIDPSGVLAKRAVAIMWQAAEIATIPPDTRSAITSLANLIDGSQYD